jgi:predicted nucleic-acid-binding Zn-ribbon protein
MTSPFQCTPAFTCPRCGSLDFRFTWQTFANGTRHVRRTCRRCGRFGGYAAQSPENVAAADAGTPAPAPSLFGG